MVLKKVLCVLALCAGATLSGFGQTGPLQRADFSFAFMTDIHIKPDPYVIEAFEKVIDTVNKLNVDFVITGGDMVYDVMRGNVKKSDSLFSLFKEMSSRINAPVYKCIGNHELFGIYAESDVDSTHKDYKYGMFERYFGKTYYSFDHEGWHFIVLNSLDVRNKRYLWNIGEEQLEWLREDLAGIAPETPVVVTMHVPLVTVMEQVYPKPEKARQGTDPLDDRAQLLEAFKGHNLKLVLQGHLHWLEHLNIKNETHFFTGGSVAGRPSWRGTDNGPRGFLLFNVRGSEFDWRYIAYE